MYLYKRNPEETFFTLQIPKGVYCSNKNGYVFFSLIVRKLNNNVKY